MIRPISAAAVFAFALLPWTAQAAERTAVLEVFTTCQLCGPIVKKTLSRVPGVKHVQLKANADSGAVATVIFDDTITNVAALVSATTNAGYPSKPTN